MTSTDRSRMMLVRSLMDCRMLRTSRSRSSANAFMVSTLMACKHSHLWRSQ